VNKKKQKNFVNLAWGCTVFRFRVPAQLNKSFLLLFFKKEAFLLRLNALIWLIIIPQEHLGFGATP